MSHIISIELREVMRGRQMGHFAERQKPPASTHLLSQGGAWVPCLSDRARFSQQASEPKWATHSQLRNQIQQHVHMTDPYLDSFPLKYHLRQLQD